MADAGSSADEVEFEAIGKMHATDCASDRLRNALT